MSEKSTPANDIAQLIQLGREQGYLTHSDITDTLPDGSTDEDNFEEIIQVLGDMGIKVLKIHLIKMNLCLAKMKRQMS